MERQRRQQQEAAAAAVLHAALTLLNRGPTGGLCKEPLSPAMFSRPNVKGLQAALHLLHYRIRGAARTKKELQHIFPALEPGQAREFKAAMHSWLRELGAAGCVLPETVQYFVSAYSGGNSHRTVLMLLDLSTIALSKELGEGPLAELEPVQHLVQPHHAASRGVLLRDAPAAAAAALRRGQQRMDEVVAVMQRIKQLQALAVGQLAAAPGSGGALLAGHVPALFGSSQAAIKRGELVLELLTHGPPLTTRPEAVRPDSWADLVAAGKAGSGGGNTGGSTAAAGAAARRLSNPAQEACNFAAQGLAADADIARVHSVLAMRLEAAGAALLAAMQGGAAPDSPEVLAALAEAAACRESITLSIRQELAAAQVRAELAASAGGTSCPALLQLAPPSHPPCNPVSEGLQAAQGLAGCAVGREPVSGNGCGSGWGVPGAHAVQSLRRSMWARAEAQGSCACNTQTCGEEQPGQLHQAEAATDSLATQLLHSGSRDDGGGGTGSAAAAAAGCSSSKPAGRRSLLDAGHPSRPSQARTVSSSSSGCGMSTLPSPAKLAVTDWSQAPSLQQMEAQEQQQQQQEQEEERRDQMHHQGQQQQQQQGSPCMAESCASAWMAGDSHRQRSQAGSSSTAHAADGRGHVAAALAASPMVSAAASFMPARSRREEEEEEEEEEERQQQHQHQQHCSQRLKRSPVALQASSSTSIPPAADAAAPPFSPPLRLLGDFSPLASTPRPRSFGENAASPAGAVPWREAARAAAACAAAAAACSLKTTSQGRRRGASVTVTFTPPRRLSGDSPLQQQQQQQHYQQPPACASPLGYTVPATPARSGSGGSSSNGTPVSRLFRGSEVWQASPVPSPVLQPLQQQLPRPQPRQDLAQPLHLGRGSGMGSPGEALLASCFKSRGPASLLSPFSPAALPDGEEQQAPASISYTVSESQQPQQPAPQPWAIPAAHSPSLAATPVPSGRPASPLHRSGSGSGSGSLGRWRSAALHTTCSPAGCHQQQQKQQPHRLSGGASGGAHTPIPSRRRSVGSGSGGGALSPPCALDTSVSHRAAAELQQKQQDQPQPQQHEQQQEQQPQQQHYSAAGLVTPPRSLLDSPGTSRLTGRTVATSSVTAGGGGGAAAGVDGGLDISALMQRMALLPRGRQA